MNALSSSSFYVRNVKILLTFGFGHIINKQFHQTYLDVLFTFHLYSDIIE